MRPGYVYLIQNLINGACYVGESHNPTERWQGHQKGARHQQTRIYRAMRKYGINNFQFDVVETWPSEKIALAAEAELIVYLKAMGADLYNMTDGGEGSSGFHHSEDVRDNIRQHALNRGLRISSDEQRQKQRDSMHRYWLSLSPEVRKKKHRPKSATSGSSPTGEETKQKLPRYGRRGIKHSPQSKEQIRLGALKREARKRMFRQLTDESFQVRFF